MGRMPIPGCPALTDALLRSSLKEYMRMCLIVKLLHACTSSQLQARDEEKMELCELEAPVDASSEKITE